MNSLTALADPTRQRIVELLSHGERAAGDITAEFDISAPAVSQHLKILREAELVSVRVDAQRRIYTLNPKGLDDVDAWLSRVRQFWADRLDKLEAAMRQDGQAAKVTTKRPRGSKA